MASCVGIQGQVGLQFIVMLSQDGRGYRSAVVSEFDETRVRAWAADTIAKNMDRMMKKTVTQYMPNTIRANTRLSTCAEHRGRSTRSDVASRRRRPVDSRGITTTASWRRCLVKTPSTRPLSLTRRDGPDAVRNSSKSQKRPPTSSSPGDDARRWREGPATPQNAEIAPPSIPRSRLPRR